MFRVKSQYFLYVAWLQSWIATLGSLYFSEILKLPPCVLCWYQRIFMYPLVAIIAIGILRRDPGVAFYILSLSIPGGLVAFYQYLLQREVLPESAAPCVQGISCTTTYIEWFGFITIPFLSLVAFAVITASAYLYLKTSRAES
ncbi:disulfide bond formation protein B [Candidatus Gottesmanbacteria bacterium]|nr:disulfide bond formation protein B [Candidatus Gottesmanbacteria bacterium]